MVVRLGFPTSPGALRELLGSSLVEIRFFTNPSFHPKLYIFGDKSALVGSANLTRAAVLTNQEVVVQLESDDPRFSELSMLFSEYWQEAEVLTKESIDKYEKIYNKYKSIAGEIEKCEVEVTKVIGDIVFSNITRDKKVKTREAIFLDTYSKSYQETVSSFTRIRDVYVQYQRKVLEAKVPLRIEMDSFFSFVRDRHAIQEKWRETGLGWNTSVESNLRELIQEWLQTPWPHFEETIVGQNYPLISRIFDSTESIGGASDREIVEALSVLHSFHDRLRFYKGGLESLKQEFLDKNTIEKIRKSFRHLLFGPGDIVGRMADLIFNPDFKLDEFGESNIQELVGWINSKELPVINGRTTKVLRYFGFDVKQL